MDKLYPGEQRRSGTTGSVCSMHGTAPATLVSKTQESKTHKRERAAVVREPTKKQRREEAAANVVAARTKFQCLVCNKAFRHAAPMRLHTCFGRKKRQQQQCQQIASIENVTTMHADEPRPDGSTTADDADAANAAESQPISEDEVAQGHGLLDGRLATDVDPVAEQVLEQEFLKGVLRKGQKQGIFDMEQAIARVIPLTKRPGRYRIGSWVSGRLEREKKGNGGSVNRKAKQWWQGTKAFKLQTEAAVLPNNNGRDRLTTNDPSTQRHFRMRYRGVKLLMPVKASGGENERYEQRFVLDVTFKEGGWVAVTDVESGAQQNVASVAVGVPAVASASAVVEHVPSYLDLKLTQVGKFIKAYNVATYVVEPEPEPELELPS